MVEVNPVSGPVRQPARTGWSSARLEKVLIAVLALAGAALVLYITRLGAYLSDDSYFYIYPARDLLAGKGFHPSYIFAPFYPLVLAVLSLPGNDPVITARWANAFLFGLNIFLSARIVRRMGAPAGFPLLAAALLLLADVVAEAHGWVMSEALSFTMMLLCLDQTLAYLTSTRRRFLWIAAACAALTILTRYAALPVAGAVGLTVLLFAPYRRFWERLREAFFFGAASLLPITLYWARNQLTSGHPVRYQSYQGVPFDSGQLTWFLYHWLSLFIPGRLLHGREILVGALALAGGTGLIGVLVWKYGRQPRLPVAPAYRSGVFLLGSLLILNLLMLYLARGLTELDVFNPRYLVPMLIVFLVLLVAASGRLWQVAGPTIRVALAVFFAVFLAYYGYRTLDFSRQMARMGLGYANITWHNSETIPYIRAHPEMTEIISTAEMGIYFWTGRKPQVLAEYPSNQALKEALCGRGATLFLMEQMPADLYGISHDEAVKGFQLVQKFNDSEMYRCPNGEH